MEQITDLKEKFMQHQWDPDVQEFAKELSELVPEMEIPLDLILETVFEKLITGMASMVTQTHEYKKSKNWYRSLSLIIWTEMQDGAEDYTERELKFLQLFMNKMSGYYPDLDYHKNTRLILPSKN